MANDYLIYFLLPLVQILKANEGSLAFSSQQQIENLKQIAGL